MDQDTIQSDVQTTTSTTTEDKQPQKTPRELELERIEARHHQQVAAENGFELPAEEAPAPETDSKPAAVADAPPADNKPATADDQLAAQLNDDNRPTANLPPTVKVKVDGEEAEVPLDDVIRQYQKNSSADRRLAEATRLLREAQETAARRQLEAQQQAPAAAPAATTTEQAPASEPDAAGKEFLSALFSGDEETAYAKLIELTKGRQPAEPAQPTLDIDQLTQAVTQHVQQKLVVESALAQHRKDYPQVYADPDMEGFVLTKVQGIRRDTGREFFDVLNEVSADFATKFGWNQPAAAAADPGRQDDPASTTSSRAMKLERKAQIDNVSSVHTKSTSTEPQPENTSDVIAQMKAARGG